MKLFTDGDAHPNSCFPMHRFLQVNSDCAISSEKRIALVQPSGMATAIVDSCTSLVSNVLDYHLTSMIDDGFIEQEWKNHLSRFGTIDCIPDTRKNGWFDDADTFSLTIVDVGGIFIVHVVLSVAAVGLAIYQFKDKAKKGLLPESRTLKVAFGIEFVRKKLFGSDGSRTLVINERGRSDERCSDSGASETCTNIKGFDSTLASVGIFDKVPAEDEYTDKKAKWPDNSILSTAGKAAVGHTQVNLDDVDDSCTGGGDGTSGMRVLAEMSAGNQTTTVGTVYARKQGLLLNRETLNHGADGDAVTENPAEEVVICESFSV